MMKKHWTVKTVTLLACMITCSSGRVFANQTWTWDTETEADNWHYWAKDAEKGVDEPIIWYDDPPGGHNGSPFVYAPMDELYETFGAKWPAYSAPTNNGANPADPVELANGELSIWVNDFGSLANNPDMRFFIGQYDGQETPDTGDDEYIFFSHNTSISIGDNTWENTVFPIGGDSNWAVIDQRGMTGVNPSDLYTNPQQWGFVITDGSATYTADQYLGFDDLTISAVPEPSSAMLVMTGLLAAAGYRNLRKREEAEK